MGVVPAKAGTTPKLVKEIREIKEFRELKEIKEIRELKEVKEIKEFREIKDTLPEQAIRTCFWEGAARWAFMTDL